MAFRLPLREIVLSVLGILLAALLLPSYIAGNTSRPVPRLEWTAETTSDASECLHETLAVSQTWAVRRGWPYIPPEHPSGFLFVFEENSLAARVDLGDSGPVLALTLYDWGWRGEEYLRDAHLERLRGEYAQLRSVCLSLPDWEAMDSTWLPTLPPPPQQKTSRLLLGVLVIAGLIVWVARTRAFGGQKGAEGHD